MQDFFSGKQIKNLGTKKDLNDIVFRLSEDCQIVEFFSRGDNFEDRSCTSVEAKSKALRNSKEHTFVYMFAGHLDTTWRFFARSLRPNDQVSFQMRENHSSLLKECDVKTYELRAVVYRMNGRGEIAEEFQTTLLRENRKAS